MGMKRGRRRTLCDGSCLGDQFMPNTCTVTCSAVHSSAAFMPARTTPAVHEHAAGCKNRAQSWTAQTVFTQSLVCNQTFEGHLPAMTTATIAVLGAHVKVKGSRWDGNVFMNPSYTSTLDEHNKACKKRTDPATGRFAILVAHLRAVARNQVVLRHVHHIGRCQRRQRRRQPLRQRRRSAQEPNLLLAPQRSSARRSALSLLWTLDQSGADSQGISVV